MRLVDPVHSPPCVRGRPQSHTEKHHRLGWWASLGHSARGGNQPEVPLVLPKRLGSALVPNATSVSCSEGCKVGQVETTGLVGTLSSNLLAPGKLRNVLWWGSLLDSTNFLFCRPNSLFRNNMAQIFKNGVTKEALFVIQA